MLFARIDPPHAPQTRLGRVLDLAGLDFGGGCESPSPSWASLGGISGVLKRFVCLSNALGRHLVDLGRLLHASWLLGTSPTSILQLPGLQCNFEALVLLFWRI